MGSSSSWPLLISSALGPPEAVAPLGGGAWRARVGDRQVLVKVGPGTADEADGLRRLAAVAGGPPVPDVVLAQDDVLVTGWVDQGARSAAAEEGLGRSLAHLHAAPWPAWGGGSGWIGACPVDPAEKHSAASFYGGRMVELAGRCGLGRPVELVAGRLDDLIPPGPPALVHGDLWWGNVLWGADGRAWVIDPSTHGGHPEEDLAMLGLFGDVPRRLVDAYRDARPLAGGWSERVELFQLYPLLVHAVLFGGSYRSQAEAVARRYA